jgi:hypothetical protein
MYNQLTAILMPRELGKTLIFVLGQTLPDFMDSNSIYTKCTVGHTCTFFSNGTSGTALLIIDM